ILALSVEARSVFVRPAEITDKQETAKFLADTLKLPLSRVRADVASGKNFVWIGRKVDPVLAEAVKAGKKRGVYLTTEFERVYPLKHMAGQLLGFVDVDDNGIEGLEKAFDEQLAGQSSRQVLQRDASGRRLYTQVGDNFDDLTGDTLRLTLDSEIQFLAETALAQGVAEFGARWAGCIVVDVPTGDILAWAEYPFFNPNRFREFSDFERRNKLATDALEQGSTIKPFLMAAALQEGVVRPDTEFDCEKGKWKLRNVTIRDTSVNERLTAHEILQVSSNIGAAKIGLSLGAQKYHEYLTRLGFGQKSGLPLAGESKGILRSPGQWAEVDTASASFGQGFSATGLQMAQAYLALANGGVMKPLRLVLDGDTQDDEQERIFSVSTMLAVNNMLRDAVEEKRSTGRRARIPGVHVGGKTGTAQKASGDSYGDGRVSSFVGYAPLEAPRYLVFVVFDEPVKNAYGGVVAAPVFQNVTMRAMAYHGVLPEGAAQIAEQVVASTPARAGAGAGGNAALEEGGEIAAVQAAAPAPGQILSSGLGTPPAAAAVPSGPAPKVVGLSVRRAVEQFAAHGLVPQIRGSGTVVIDQKPAAGSPLSGQPGQPGQPGQAGQPAECILWLGEIAS
ncbi:PASTA domain-containing protein, partial [Desulfovibrio sp. OttesenSCG-928-I05]|nr:PASTA domain-containing protein [Desulfovibrio sp. OttesenSCG-928-I05]